MSCIKCNKKYTDSTFFVETICCPCCDEDIKIGFHVCRSCKTIWKTVNDKVCKDSCISANDLSGVIGNSSTFIDRVNKHGPVSCDYTDRNSRSMSDYVNKCLQCNNIAIKTGDDTYSCSVCAFEWEIVSKGR